MQIALKLESRGSLKRSLKVSQSIKLHIALALDFRSELQKVWNSEKRTAYSGQRTARSSTAHSSTVAAALQEQCSSSVAYSAAHSVQRTAHSVLRSVLRTACSVPIGLQPESRGKYQKYKTSQRISNCRLF